MISLYLLFTLLHTSFVYVSSSCSPACTPGNGCTSAGNGYYYCQAAYYGMYCPNPNNPLIACSTATAGVSQSPLGQVSIGLCTTCNSNNCNPGFYWDGSECTIAPANYYNPSASNGNLYFCPSASTNLPGQASCRWCKPNEFMYIMYGLS